MGYYYFRLTVVLLSLTVLILCVVRLAKNMRNRAYCRSNGGTTINSILCLFLALTLVYSLADLPVVFDLPYAVTHTVLSVDGTVTRGSADASHGAKMRLIKVLDQQSGEIVTLQLYVESVNVGEAVSAAYLPHSHIAVAFARH